MEEIFYTVIEYTNVDAEVHHYRTFEAAKRKAELLAKNYVQPLTEVKGDNILFLLHDGIDYIEVQQSRFATDIAECED